MARNREALVLLLDVGPSMHKLLPEVSKICSMILQRKLVYSKYDEIGIVLFGTQETENDVMVEVGGYEHVFVFQNIRVVDGHLVDSLQQLPRGTVAGDFLDAIVVGMDMLIKKYGVTNKGKKRLCLISNGLSPVKDPFEGSKEDQVRTIAGQMMSYGMKLECTIVRGRLSGDANETIMKDNDHLLTLFPKETFARTLYVESPTSLLGAIRTRNISLVAIYRGDFEISSRLKIKVRVYKKTLEEKFPTLKIYSDKAPPTDKFATHEVKVDYMYKSLQDSSKVVPPEQRIKGYRYGPQVVPVSSDEWEAVKFKPEKSVKVLGFTGASNILRHYYMKDVSIFIAEPGDTNATIAVSALARAMKEMNKVAILRCVWRQGRGNVVVGVLSPNVSNSDHKLDSFYFNVLPFSEDIRDFQFHSFSNLPASLQPDGQQQEAADNLVKMLDLAPADREEALQPDFTPNPILERFYRCLDLKSKNPDAAIPPLDETLKRITEPDVELLAQNKSAIDAFCGHFEIKENPKLKKKSAKRFTGEKPSGSDDEDDFKRNSFRCAIDSIEDTTGSEIEKIGDLTPIKDFEAMMSRRDSPEWVNKAIKAMKNKICNLVKDSVHGDNCNKVLELLVALRKGCIIEQEPEQFNDFLRQLCKFCQEPDSNLKSFYDLLATKELMLISKSEAVDSDVTDEAGRNILVKAEQKTE